MAKFSEILAHYMLQRNRDRSFFAFTVHQLRVISDNIRTPMMATSVRDRRLCLYVNHDWVEKTSVQEVMDTIDHEAVHIIANHIPRYLELWGDTTVSPIANINDLMNIAVDLAANQFLINGGNTRITMPDWLVPGGGVFSGFDPDWSFEQHLDKLLSAPERKEFSVTLRSGHNWGEDGKSGEVGAEGALPPDAKKEIQEHIKIVVSQAKETYEKRHGSLTGSLGELVNRLLAPPKINWKEVMRNIAQGSLLSTKRRSFRRPYRRHAGIPLLCCYPGRASDTTFQIVVCIDTSGSMGQKELGQALAILEDMLRIMPGLHVTVIEADTDVKKVYPLEEVSEIQWNVNGRGGTDFDAAIKAANEYTPDIVFFYTDGWAAEPEERTMCPFVWLLSPDAKDPCESWGHHLWMD